MTIEAVSGPMRWVDTNTITSGASYVAKNDASIVVNKGTGSPTAITMPAQPTRGQFLLISDDKGDAGTNNITITPAAGTIDGNANYVIAVNYGKVLCQYNGSEWQAVMVNNWSGNNLTVPGSLTVTGSGLVTTVSNSDGTLTVSPTSGSVVASLALGHANVWTGGQTFNTVATTFGVGVITPKIYPATDGTAAIEVTKADASTVIVRVDTTHDYVGFGAAAPQAQVDINSAAAATFAEAYINNSNGGSSVDVLAYGSTAGGTICGVNNTGSMVSIYKAGTGGNVVLTTGNSTGAMILGINSSAQLTINAGIITAAAWIQNTQGEAALASNFTDATGTLAATNISVTVMALRSYRIEGYLIVSNSTAADGFQCDFAGGSASATTFDVALSAVGSDVAGTVVGTAINTKLNYTTITGTNRIRVSGYLKVNAGGTIIFRAATNTTASGTMTLAAGSWIALYDTVRL